MKGTQSVRGGSLSLSEVGAQEKSCNYNEIGDYSIQVLVTMSRWRGKVQVTINWQAPPTGVYNSAQVSAPDALQVRVLDPQLTHVFAVQRGGSQRYSRTGYVVGVLAVLRYWFVAQVTLAWQAPPMSVNPLAQVSAAVLEQVRALLEQLTQVLAGDQKHQRSRSREKRRRDDALPVLRY